MNLVRNRLPLLLGLVASITALAIDKDKVKFVPPELDTVQTKLTVSDVTIGAIPYESDSEAASAFGKVQPYDYGILPVLVLIRNNTKAAIRLEQMKVEYHDRNRQIVENTPASEVQYVEPPKRPTFGGPQIPGISRKKKNKLAEPEIETRAFSAKMLPPGDSASGFFYFRTGHRSGSTLYVKGLQDAATGKDLFFFEIPLE